MRDDEGQVGYAKAYRKRWTHPVFRSLQEAAVWAWMTDCASFRTRRIWTKFGAVDLARGELLISERFIAEQFGLHKNVVRNLLFRMVSEKMIALNRDHKASRAGTIARIVNYDKYQSVEDEIVAAGTKAEPDTGPRRDQGGTKAGPQENKGKEGKEEKPYRYAGRVIRLTANDYDRWRRSFHAIPDFDAELQRIDDKLASGEIKGKWYPAVSAMLAAKHQKILETRAAQMRAGPPGYLGPG